MRVRIVALVLAWLAAVPAWSAGPPAGGGAAASAGPGWAQGAVFYEVFVRSFADSDGDGKGDLAGLTARLDHLRSGQPGSQEDLGVDAIWLMPIFKSPSYHGYDTSDYETVNRDYGTNEDFVRLCREGHRRGLRGSPFIYYGEEIGLRQPNNGDDEFKRTPMPWDGSPGAGFSSGTPWQRLRKDHQTVNVAAQAQDRSSLLWRYRQLIRLRRGSEALRLGNLELLPSSGGLPAFVRRSGHQAALVVHNLGTAPARAGPLALPGRKPVQLFADPGVAPPALGPGGWTIGLPPLASGVWKLEAP